MNPDIAERTLQRAIHAVLAEPEQRWTCANGSRIQVVAAGIINVHDGPDLRDVAVLHDGVIHVGHAEIHLRTSDWLRHGHGNDPRYGTLLLHIVQENDVQLDVARWTLVMPPDMVRRGLALVASRRTMNAELPVDELQQQALLRLLRSTAAASVLIRRLGPTAAVRAMATAWIERMLRRRHRPIDAGRLGILRSKLDASPLGLLVRQLPIIQAADICPSIDRAERTRIAYEGPSVRREVFVNAVLPVLCALATDEQRVALFGWYWSARAVHPYGHLYRRFATIPQDHVWQQQGMLEYLRTYGERTSVCADITRMYGIDHTVQFLRVAVGGEDHASDQPARH